MIDTDDLTTGNWTATNLTAVKNAADPGGVANKAWTLTDDATAGNHHLTQSDATIFAYWPGDRISWSHKLFVNATQSTAAYITLGGSPDGGTDTEDCTIRLSDGVIVDGYEYYASGGNGQMDVVRQFTGANGDIWLEIVVDSYRTGAANGNYTIAFNSTGVTATGDSYVGTGDTLVVAYPSLWAGFWNIHYGTMPPLELNYQESHQGPHYFNNLDNRQFINNSQMAGYRGKGTTPNQLFWGEIYYWFESDVTTAEADNVDISSEPGAKAYGVGEGSYYSRIDGTWDEANACRVYGTGQYSLRVEEYTLWWYGYEFTFSVHIDDIAERPEGPVVMVETYAPLNGGVEPIYAYMDDMDEDGWISVSFTSWRGNAWAYEVGLGVDRNDDTGDFTWSRPQLTMGRKRAKKYVPTDFGTWAHRFPIPADAAEPVSSNAFMDHRRGLMVVPAKPNLLLNTSDWSQPQWIFTNSQEHNANAYRAWDQHAGAGRGNGAGWVDGDGTPGTGELSLSQNITVTAATRYSVDWYHWNAFGVSANTRNTWRYGEVGNGAQDCSYYLNCYTEGNLWNQEQKGEFGTLGADWTHTYIKQTGVYQVIAGGELTSAGTTITPKIQAADADLDNQTSMGTSRYTYAGILSCVEGGMPYYPNTWDAAAADIIKTTDVSWYDETGGTVYLDFSTHRDVINGTFFSISDGAAGNDRIELVTDASGVLRLQVTNTGSLVADVAGPTLEYSTSYKVAVRLQDNLVSLIVDGVTYTPDTAVTLPTGLTQCNLGSNYADANVMHGWIHEVAYWDEILDDSEATAISTVGENITLIGAQAPKRAR